MRIISGKFRGRIFRPGKSFKARPTTDFARENLFNILIHRLDFDDLKILDLFSGTGSISFEFASRGCSDITCVEYDSKHYRFIRSVIEKLELNEAIRAVRADVFRYIGKSTGKFDIIFADPPYDLGRIDEIPDLIFNNGMVNADGIIILEHGKSNNFKNHPKFQEMRTYGSVHFSFFKE
jgi:16S rRNA (guanine(966)-N(2))-methyltransferase RsmD